MGILENIAERLAALETKVDALAEGTSIAIQNVNEAVVAQVPSVVPRLVRPEPSADRGGVLDAEIIEEMRDAEK